MLLSWRYAHVTTPDSEPGRGADDRTAVAAFAARARKSLMRAVRRCARMPYTKERACRTPRRVHAVHRGALAPVRRSYDTSLKRAVGLVARFAEPSSYPPRKSRPCAAQAACCTYGRCTTHKQQRNPSSSTAAYSSVAWFTLARPRSLPGAGQISIRARKRPLPPCCWSRIGPKECDEEKC